MTLLFSLIQTMSVFLVVAYLYCKSPGFKPLAIESPKLLDKVFLYFFFSAISMMGTYLGLPIQDALANTRAIGPVLAGIIGGPILGTAVGFTGGLHRYFFGGFTALSCGLSTTTEGLIGGLVHLLLVRNNKADHVFDPKVVFLTTIIAEAVQMGIILAVSRPYSEAFELVKVIALPMIATSSTGAALFMSIIRDQRNVYDKAAATFSTKALRIAERTLNILATGFGGETAPEMARIIHEETGVGAVAITDTQSVLAFVGHGSDHHLPGAPIASPLTRRAIAENTVIFADGVHERHVCPLSDSCPLTSVLVVPLTQDNDVIGAIKLYEPRQKRFLNMNKSLGEGIAALLSNQLLLSRYEQQKNLLVMAELKLIQAQVNPHFLFNSLNTIISIIRQDADRARELLIHLSNFFRKNLKRSGNLSTLEEELDHVNSYLKIEKARFEDRLTVEMDIDPSLLHIQLPTFTLQPLIENAIKHGVSNMLEQGKTLIRAYRKEGLAFIEIEDNAGAYEENGGTDGLGIKIVDRRIKFLMGNSFGTSITCVPNEYTRVTVKIPAGGVPEECAHSS
ncbi:MAG: sensor histidine kinase [Desulfobacteraceae bacterium]|nr:sensor histidine kinase [Desulfobacteraceae bacterium]